jgi:predicted esterase
VTDAGGARQPVERHLEVTRTARYWTLGDQARAHPEVWFVLHGYKQLARRFLRRFEPVDDGRRLIVAPEALSRFYVSPEPGRHGPESVVGATWMTREDRESEIRDYVAYLDRLAGVVLHGGERVTVLGFSQGVATATRWVTYGAIRPARLVLWADLLPPDLDMGRAAAALAGTEVLLVRGEDDRSLAPRLVADEAGRLSAAGIGYRTIVYPGGHDIDAGTLMDLGEA